VTRRCAWTGWLRWGAICLKAEGKMPSVHAGETPATRVSAAIRLCGPLGGAFAGGGCFCVQGSSSFWYLGTSGDGRFRALLVSVFFFFCLTLLGRSPMNAVHPPIGHRDSGLELRGVKREGYLPARGLGGVRQVLAGAGSGHGLRGKWLTADYRVISLGRFQ